MQHAVATIALVFAVFMLEAGLLRLLTWQGFAMQASGAIAVAIAAHELATVPPGAHQDAFLSFLYVGACTLLAVLYAALALAWLAVAYARRWAPASFDRYLTWRSRRLSGVRR